MTQPTTKFPPRFDPVPLLDPADVVALQRQIEAGVLASWLKVSGRRPIPVTEAELALLEQAGELARQRFIRANLPLVAMVARQFAGRGGVSAADLFQEGCVGLIIAVERFDYARGHRFSTYALFWIRAYIGAAAARHLGDLNLPTSRAESLRLAHACEADLAQRLGRQPTVAELAAALGRGERWTAGLLAYERPRSLDDVDASQLPDSTALASFDQVGSGTTAAELLNRLDAVSRQILQLRLGFATGEPQSLAETARRLKIPVSRVRRLEQAAYETLRGCCPQQALALL